MLTTYVVSILLTSASPLAMRLALHQSMLFEQWIRALQLTQQDIGTGHYEERENGGRNDTANDGDRHWDRRL